MKKMAWYSAKGSTRYAALPKIIFTLISLLIMISYEDGLSSQEIISSRFYYIPLLVNMIVAVMLILVVYRITLSLDYFYPWGRSYKKRLRLQLLYGVGFTFFLVATFAVFLYWVTDFSISGFDFFRSYFMLIIFMLVTLSAYLFHEWSIKNNAKSTPKNVFKLEHQNPFHGISISDIACVFIDKKNYFAFNFKGEKLVWTENLSTTIIHLPEHEFYMIRSSFIINRNAIKEVIIPSPRITKIVLIATVGIQKEVSRRENTSFKKWMAADILK